MNNDQYAINQEEIYKAFSKSFQYGIVVTDHEDTIILMNELAQKLFYFLSIDIEEKNLKISDLLENYKSMKNLHKYETHIKNAQRKSIAVSQHMIESSGRESGKLFVIEDISESKLAEKALYQERERAWATLQCLNDAVIITDISGFIEYLNPVAEQFTGWRDAEAHGLPLYDVFSVLDETTRQPLLEPVQLSLGEGCTRQIPRCLVRHRDGQERVIEYTVTPIHDRQACALQDDPPSIGAVFVLRDVSEIVAMARQIAYQESHDPLTGLANRRTFEALLDQAMRSATKENAHHVLCYLDLDQFKLVNDTCGHVAGDQLLLQLTRLLQAKVRHTDILSRLGGDEFGIILQDCPLEQACQVAEEIRYAIKEECFTWHDKSFELGVSIGLVPITANSGDLAEVLSAADAACYVAKDQGRNRLQVYQPDNTVLVQRHGEMEWVHRITRALTEKRLCLYTQTILPLSTKKQRHQHCEVLLRMIDEQGQLVPPMAFIPAAERYNLMPTLDRWVVRTAFGLMASQTERDAEPMHFAINLSGGSLCDDQFLSFVIEQLQQSGVAATCVCFEITETAAIANLDRATAFIATLRQLGCRFALDDFGSGLSSFAYLKHLPVDYLKIDGSFVKGMLDDPIDASMVASINQIGHVMGMQTIAEFVENDAMQAKLTEIGVDYAQGYGIDKPKPFFLPQPCTSASVLP